MRYFLILTLLSLTAFAFGEDLVVTGSEGGAVKITGLNSVPSDQVREWIGSQLEYIDSAGVSMARADDVAYFLENALRERGFKKSTVDWKLVDGANGKKQILLSVDEGPEVVIGDIRVSGNKAIEDEAVIELLTSHTRKRLAVAPEEKIPYVSQDIRKGVDRTREFYQRLGFPDIKIDLDTGNSESYRIDLALDIVEGNQYRVGSITLPESPDPKVAKGYDEIQEDFGGKTYSATIPANLSSRLTSLARDAGFYDAVVSVESGDAIPTETENTVERNLVVSADWGDRVPVSSIKVNGNEKVTDRFFDRHFEDVVGENYSPNAVNGEVEELLKTGAFESVRTDAVRQEDGSIELNVEIEEAASRQLGVYAGFATYEGPIAGFEFRNLNLLGSVRKADAEIELSRRGARGEIEYQDPWFAWSDVGLRASLFAMNRLERGYSKHETGGRYEFSRKFGLKKQNKIALFGQASYTDVYEADIDPLALGDRNYFASTTGLSFTIDRRDNPRAPRKGFVAQTSISIASDAIASEVEFLRATGRLGYYLPVGESTLRLSARAGTISPMGDTNEIPIDLRFYNGGAQSVRSFQERSLGARDKNGYHIGGEFYTIFNIEYEIPVPVVDGLSVVPFADAGNLLGDADDASLDAMRYAVGLGLRYQTPIGPLRLEYGYNPDQVRGEPEGTFHIGFGVAY